MLKLLTESCFPQSNLRTVHPTFLPLCQPIPWPQLCITPPAAQDIIIGLGDSRGINVSGYYYCEQNLFCSLTENPRNLFIPLPAPIEKLCYSTHVNIPCSKNTASYFRYDLLLVHQQSHLISRVIDALGTSLDRAFPTNPLCKLGGICTGTLVCPSQPLLQTLQSKSHTLALVPPHRNSLSPLHGIPAYAAWLSMPPTLMMLAEAPR